MNDAKNHGPVQSMGRPAPDAPARAKRGAAFHIRNLVIVALTVAAVLFAPSVLDALPGIVTKVTDCHSASCFYFGP
jgi:hypothetical protein